MAGGTSPVSCCEHSAVAKQGEDRDTRAAHVDPPWPQEFLAVGPLLWRGEGCDVDLDVGPRPCDLLQACGEQLAGRTEGDPERQERERCRVGPCERNTKRLGLKGRIVHMSDDIARDRERAIAVLHDWVQGEGLRRHVYATEAAMRAYARELGEDEDVWGNVGLLHDFDWERHPTLDQHPQDGEPVLAAAGYPDWFRRAILSHADHLDVPRESPLERHLYACDELPSFVHACARVRPEGFEGLEPKSVKKKLKQPSFAAGVNRDDVMHGAEGIGRDLDDHIRLVVAALTPIAAQLGVGE